MGRSVKRSALPPRTQSRPLLQARTHAATDVSWSPPGLVTATILKAQVAVGKSQQRLCACLVPFSQAADRADVLRFSTGCSSRATGLRMTAKRLTLSVRSYADWPARRLRRPSYSGPVREGWEPGLAWPLQRHKPQYAV